MHYADVIHFYHFFKEKTHLPPPSVGPHADDRTVPDAVAVPPPVRPHVPDRPDGMLRLQARILGAIFFYLPDFASTSEIGL